jgi:hypothetical protein
MIDHGVSESDAEVALNFQLTVARYNMPMAIAPFAYAIKDKPNANRFFTSFHHNNIGANGAGAIPLLKDALRGKDPVIAAAARQSLLLINTPEAQAVLSAPAP